MRFGTQPRFVAELLCDRTDTELILEAWSESSILFPSLASSDKYRGLSTRERFIHNVCNGFRVAQASNENLSASFRQSVSNR